MVAYRLEWAMAGGMVKALRQAMLLFFLLIGVEMLAMRPVRGNCPVRGSGTIDTTFNQTDRKGRKQGFWKKYYRNGQVAYRAQFQDGHPIGCTRRYNEKGVLIATLHHDAKHGIAKAKIYNDEGSLIAIGNYRDQRKDSIWTLYSGGRVVAREAYANGEKEGTWERYSDAGVLASREHWRHGVREGRQESYFADGRLQAFWTAHEGVEDGPSATLYTSGRPRLKGQFTKGLREGLWVAYNVDGSPQDTLIFSQGKLVKGTVGGGDADSALRLIYRNVGKLREPTESDGAYGGRRW